MAVLTNTLLQAQCNVVVDALDGGAVGPPSVVLYDVSDNVLATIPLDNTAAFGSATLASPSVATATGLPINFVGTGAGTAVKYTARNKSGTECWHGLCGPEAGKMHLSDYVIAVGKAGRLTAFTWSQPTGSE